METDERSYSIQCNVCEEFLDLSAKLNDHLCVPASKIQFKISDKAIITCDDCGKEFETLQQIKAHFSYSHSVFSYICVFCGAKKPKRWLITTHIREQHSSQHSYTCTECSKKFQTSFKLWDHVNQYHRKIRCSFCNIIGFRSNQELGNHIRSKHSKERIFSCKWCKKTFMTSSVLYAHQKSHEVEDKFECDICKKTYKRACYLKSHKIIHLGKFNYSCSICQNVFRFKHDVNKHKRLIHRGLK